MIYFSIKVPIIGILPISCRRLLQKSDFVTPFSKKDTQIEEITQDRYQSVATVYIYLYKFFRIYYNNAMLLTPAANKTDI